MSSQLGNIGRLPTPVEGNGGTEGRAFAETTRSHTVSVPRALLLDVQVYLANFPKTPMRVLLNRRIDEALYGTSVERSDDEGVAL